MAKVRKLSWPGAPDGLSRADRRPCEYEAYLPDLLIGRPYMLDGEVAAIVAGAEAAVAQLDRSAVGLASTETLARILLRAEAVASSQIEGLAVGARRLVRAQVMRGEGERGDVTAAEVIANIDALDWGIGQVRPGEAIGLNLILGVHERLMEGTRMHPTGGRLRDVQNWLGGSGFNPCRAAYVPPPPAYVAGLMDDLVTFMNTDDLPPLMQAAIAHAQFETVHPFVDGNGRTGRAVIAMVLRRRGVATRVVPPISLVLATFADEYVGALGAFRHRGPVDRRSAREAENTVVRFFAAACARAVADAMLYERKIDELRSGWRTRLGPIRSGSATQLLVDAIPGAPVLTVGGAARLIGRSLPATNGAITRLVDAGILKQITLGRRNRAFEAADVIDAFAQLERRLASPAADTRISPPGRAVPPRGR